MGQQKTLLLKITLYVFQCFQESEFPLKKVIVKTFQHCFKTMDYKSKLKHLIPIA